MTKGRLIKKDIEGFNRSPQRTQGSLVKTKNFAELLKGNVNGKKDLSATFDRYPDLNTGTLINGKAVVANFIECPGQDGKPGDFKDFQRQPNVSSGLLANGKTETASFLRNPGVSGSREEVSAFVLFERRLKEESIVADKKIFLKEPGLEYYQSISTMQDLCSYTARILYQKYGMEKRTAINYATDDKTMRRLFKELQVDPDVAERQIRFIGMENNLNVANGIVTVHNGKVELVEKNISSAFKYCINANFDESATGEFFEKFLSGFIGVDEEAHRRFWQLMGHILFDNPTGKALVWLYGRGNDGKSEFVKFLQKIILPRSAVFPSDVRTAFDKHGAAYFKDAKLLVLHETNKPITAGQVEGLKRFTGNDDFAVNPKGKEIEPNVFHLKILVTGNHLPTFEPGLLDDALKNRLQFVQVFSVPPAERVEHIADVLYQERDYFLLKAIYGFADLQSLKFQFTECEKDSLLTDVVFDNDVAGVFLTECCNVGEGEYVFGGTFKSFASDWLRINNFDWSTEVLRKALIAKGFVYCRFRAGGENRRGFKGFSIKS